MAGRVNLNVPPRLIESARAAQYANREAQGARELARRIESKVRQQRQAAKRAQPQAQAADGQGAVFDAPALKRVPRIWRKRRPLVGYKYGTAYLTLAHVNGATRFFVCSPNGTDRAEINLTALDEVAPAGAISGLSGAVYYDTPSPIGQTKQILHGLVDDITQYGNVQKNFNWTFLPAGGSSVIAVFSHYIAWAEYQFDAQHYGTATLRYFGINGELGWGELRDIDPIGGLPYYSYGVTCRVFVQGVGPDEYVAITFGLSDEHLNYNYSADQDWLNQFLPSNLFLGANSSGSALTQKAFLITDETVKEVGVGSGFAAFTANNLSANFLEEYEVYIQASSYMGNIMYPTPATKITLAPAPGVKPWPVNGTRSSLDRFYDYYSMVRFGDLNSGGVASMFGYGPGIYSYLANPTAANAAVDGAGDGPWAKQAAAEQFIGANLLPDGSLSDSSIDLKRGLLYRGTFPPPGRSISVVPNSGNSLYRYALLPADGKDDPLWELQDDEIEDSVITNSSSAPRVPLYQTPPILSQGTISSTTTPILFWDWDNPDYCERQLLRLGFSEADLTP